VGLVHDLDWEECPEDASENREWKWLQVRHGYPEEVIRGVLAHAWDITRCEPTSLMEKVIYTIDELTGFINRGGSG